MGEAEVVLPQARYGQRRQEGHAQHEAGLMARRSPAGTERNRRAD